MAEGGWHTHCAPVIVGKLEGRCLHGGAEVPGSQGIAPSLVPAVWHFRGSARIGGCQIFGAAGGGGTIIHVIGLASVNTIIFLAGKCAVAPTVSDCAATGLATH